MKMHPGRRITQYEIAGLFHEAWKTCTTLEKAENGFRASGIFPLNPDKFTVEDFVDDLRQCLANAHRLVLANAHRLGLVNARRLLAYR